MSLQPELALLRHQRRLAARWAARLGRSDAEDLASEAIARGLARPAPDGRAEPWIETIFRNLVTDAVRRVVRRGGPPGQDPGADEAFVPVDPVASPEEALLARERACAIGAALPDMPEELREAVVARFYEEREYDQMAAAGGISATTARTRVWRGLARLRRSLAALRAVFPISLHGGLGASATSLVAALAPAAAVALLVIVPAPGDGSSVVVADAAAVTMVGPSRPAPGPARKETTQGPGGLGGESVAGAGGPSAKPSPRSNGGTTTAHRTVAPSSDGDGGAAAPHPVAVRRFDFDDDDVDGELQQPGIVVVTGSGREAKLGSLIEIPTSFEPSMTKMVEDL